ncbi:hypothetical protein CCACVL1_17359 [Corchorus capsularis]|uniref:Uncharacterized protein n=1 Tax=Corchorus capsularis TaxID=210143 RepID=A0A1R3HSP2_COCAP|nr:hypothetical protein CCACVL1_17359 [Corchorus capsularis]
MESPKGRQRAFFTVIAKHPASFNIR